MPLMDLGDANARKVRDLKAGRGELLEDVAEAIEQVEAMLGEDASGKVIFPLVVIVEKKRRSKGMDFLPFPFFPFSPFSLR
jgi:hypothetical protein